MVMAVLGGDESCETLPAALDQIEPLVLAERSMAVGCCRHVEQLLDRGDVTSAHLAFYFETVHRPVRVVGDG